MKNNTNISKNKVKNLSKRWNLFIDNFEPFKNRNLTILKEVFGDGLVNGNFIKEYLELIGGKESPIIEKKEEWRINRDFLDGDFLSDSYKYNLSKDSSIYKAIDKCKKLPELIKYLEAFFCCENIDKATKTRLYQKIKETIDISNIPVRLVLENKEYIFRFEGAKLLDDKLIDEPLDWLKDYPDVYKYFHLALKQHTKNEPVRNVLDNLRFSLEQLLKKVLKNEKNLENQKNELLNFLKNKNISQEAINMYSTLLCQYATYQNENVKHSEQIPKKEEIEFIIYLTGIFIRLLIQVR